MIDINVACFVGCAIGAIFYLWGYSNGAAFAMKEVNKKLNEVLEKRENND